MPLFPTINFLAFLIYSYLLGFLLIQNPRSPLNRTMAAFLGCFALFSWGRIFVHNPTSSREIAELFTNLNAVGWIGFSSFYLWFVLVFTERERNLKTRSLLYPLLLVPPLLLLLAQWRGQLILTLSEPMPYGWGYFWADSPWSYFYYLYVASYMGTGFFLLADFRRKAPERGQRKQAEVILIFSFITFVFSIVTDIIIPRFKPYAIPFMADIITLIGAGGLVYAIVRYRLLVVTPAVAAESIISSMADSLILLDPDRRIAEVNQATLDILGYREEEMKGRDGGMVFDCVPCLQELMNGGRVKGIETTYTARDGRKVPVLFSGSIIQDPEGPVWTVCVASDVTEHKMLQEAEMARRSAEAGSRAKSEFLANMSHELRTPLNSIIGFSEVLQEEMSGGLNEQQREYLGYVITSSRHLLDIIVEILDMSKIEAGVMTLEMGRFLLKDLLISAMTMFKEKSFKHGLTMKLEVEPEADREIEADGTKLKQIMFNLLSNAVKFTPDGGTITVKAGKVTESGETPGKGREMVEVSVQDTGIGIRPEDMSKLFKEFSPIESTYEKRYEGTGLGLALTKRLVELHGGRIRAESEFGKGSTFTFVIPMESAR